MREYSQKVHPPVKGTRGVSVIAIGVKGNGLQSEGNRFRLTAVRFQPVRRQNIWRGLRRSLAECRPRLGLMINGNVAVLQASKLDGLSLDPFSLFDDGFGPAEVSVG